MLPLKIISNRIGLLVTVLLLFIYGCSSSHQLSRAQTEQHLLAQYKSWKGTPFLWGGENASGVDCSAFIKHVFQDAFEIELPRNTADQMKMGSNVNRKRLAVGDLVFFRTGRETLHAGIVLSNGRMMHASTTNGVEITELNNSYWIRNFIGARRVL